MPWTEINGVPTFVAADSSENAAGAPSPGPAPAGKNWFARHKVATAALAAVAAIDGVTAFSGGGSSDPAGQSPSSSSSSSSSSTNDGALTNREKADKAAAAVDDGRVTQYGKELYITFPIADNMTEGLRRAGLAKDTFTLLKALKNHGVDFDSVTVNGTFDMLDAYGAEKDDMHVYNADFSYETVNRIQYDNIATTELDVLERFVERDKSGAAEMWLHPAFGWRS